MRRILEPPLYTDEPVNDSPCNNSLPWNIPEESWYCPPTPRSSIIQLQKYLIEIMAFTFGADFEQLNSMLGQNAAIDSRETTILSKEEKEELMRLSTLVEDLRQKMLHNQFNTTLKRNRDIITEAIVKPAKDIRLEPDYIMYLVSTYATHQCDPSKRKFTLVSRYTPSFLRFRSSLSTADLRNTLNHMLK